VALDEGQEHCSEVWGVWRLDDCQHLGDKVPDEGVVEGLRGHAVMDVADNRENIPTAK